MAFRKFRDLQFRRWRYLYSVCVQFDVAVRTLLLLRLTRCHEYKTLEIKHLCAKTERYGTLCNTLCGNVTSQLHNYWARWQNYEKLSISFIVVVRVWPSIRIEQFGSRWNGFSCARCWWSSWLRHCATSRKVAGSIPDVVTGIFRWHNPSGRTMALGLTQSLTEMSTRNIFLGVKASGA